MEFDLTQEILDQIIYAMEDQHEEFLVDRGTGEVVSAEKLQSGGAGDRYFFVPNWKPVDGFQLMERFLVTLRNPLLRQRLRDALSSGRGVFRNFKDALRTSPEAEKRWYLFKEREMRRVVHEWYNQMRELRGLEQLPFDPGQEEQDPEELLLSEFAIRAGRPADAERALDLDRMGFAEQFSDLEEEAIAALYVRRSKKYSGLLDTGSAFVVAEDRSGVVIGMAWAILRPPALDGAVGWRITQLVTGPEYRGLGLGHLLLRRLLKELCERGACRVAVELMFGSLELADLFCSQGFHPVSELLTLDLRSWSEP